MRGSFSLRIGFNPAGNEDFIHRKKLIILSRVLSGIEIKLLEFDG